MAEEIEVGVNAEVGGYTYDEDKMQIRMNCLGCIYGSSVEEFEQCMAHVIDKILEAKKVDSIVLAKEREYEYPSDQVAMLVEVAGVIENCVREGLLRITSDNEKARKLTKEWSERVQYIVLELIRKDPIGAYVELLREERHVTMRMKHIASEEVYSAFYKYKTDVLEKIKDMMEATKIIKLAMPRIAGFHVGDRTIYREIFSPAVRPNFMLTRYIITPPDKGRSVDRYMVGDTRVEIFKMMDRAEFFYYVLPPEFRLDDERYMVLDEARRYMATHRPKTAEFVRSKHIREVFYNIGKDMIREVAHKMKVQMTVKEMEELAGILTRYTAGLGVLEILLADEKVQDVYINSPIERQPILINHQDWEECRTNLIPTMEDAEAWATRLRIQSGRPLDEANPVLDTDVEVPGGQARFAVITKSLSPYGLGFAIRRHRDKPWTLPLLIRSKAINPMAAGLLSFLIDGTVSMLVAGGRGAGKTSVLSALMLEILPKTRIITLEDSVTGECEILFEKDGIIRRGAIGELVDSQIRDRGRTELGRDFADGNPEGIRVFSIDKHGKVVLKPVSRFIRHNVNKDVFEITTRTGRRLSVTGDHSLFTMGIDGNMNPVECRKLKEGDHIVTPRELHFRNPGMKQIDLMERLEKLEGVFITGPSVGRVVEQNKTIVLEVAQKHGYFAPGPLKGITGHWKRANILPVAIVIELSNRGIKLEGDLRMKFWSSSSRIPVTVPLNEDFLTFVGLWIADGCYDKYSVIISVAEEEVRNVVRRVAKNFGLKTRMHSDGFSLMINSKPLKAVMENVLELRGSAFTKRIPGWVYGLSKEQIGYVINGLLSGDGCVSDKEIVISLRSGNLIKDLQTLLLGFGITGRCRERDGFFHCNISAIPSLKSFRDHIGFVHEKKSSRLDALCKKVSTHDSTDVVPLPQDTKICLYNHNRKFSSTDYLVRDNNVGRANLGRIASDPDFGDFDGIENMKSLAESDIFWDEVKSIKKVKYNGVDVYDISVPGTENFVCENILAHNTLELPVNQMRDLNYNIERLKSRSVITRVETEMPADEALRTALRLGDSALIVGEVRSLEARALYEAMRIGALSNVVAGTIHGESAYGVFDRVVNDLGVPKTSFKATDIIPICKSLRSADGLHRFRRMTEITEVRKRWNEDPMKEGGFVNLMEYSGKDDTLKPTDTLVNGESEVLNRIAANVKDWSGNWEAVWDSIQLRGKMKQAVVDIAAKAGRDDILEADWVCRSNSIFHIFNETVKKEIGYPDPNRVYELWEKWLKEEMKKKE